jgi:hypothetical protein
VEGYVYLWTVVSVNQDNVPEKSNMSICGGLFQFRLAVEKFSFISVLVKYKADLNHHFLEKYSQTCPCVLFS